MDDANHAPGLPPGIEFGWPWLSIGRFQSTQKRRLSPCVMCRTLEVGLGESTSEPKCGTKLCCGPTWPVYR